MAFDLSLIRFLRRQSKHHCSVPDLEGSGILDRALRKLSSLIALLRGSLIERNKRCDKPVQGNFVGSDALGVFPPAPRFTGTR